MILEQQPSDLDEQIIQAENLYLYIVSFVEKEIK